MSKKMLISTFFVIGVVGLATLSYIMKPKENNEEPVTFIVNSLIEALSIDDKIKEAELIIIGEVKLHFPVNGKNKTKKT